MELTSFEHELASKILDAINDYTIGHTTKVANIIREELKAWDFKAVKYIDEEELDKLAEDASYEEYPTDEYDNPSRRQGYYRGFKAGCRKTKEINH